MENSEYAEAGFYTKKEQSASTLFFHVLFSHFGLFIIVSLYAVAGAYAFVAIEQPHELRQYDLKQRRAVEVEQAMTYLSNLFWYQHYENYTIYNESMYGNLTELEEFVIFSVSKFKYDGTVTGWDYQWTFTKSLLFTMTIMSTIGYGHIFPVTDWGKFFCIVYSVFGCPLLLIFLGNLGNSMANAFIYIYSRCCCRMCRGRRNLEELPPNTSKKHRKLLIDDEVGKEDYMPTLQVNVPITVNLVMLFLYIMLGAVLFSFWEGWDLGSSCYFTFVTLSTIGYGDMVPGNAILNGNDTGSATFKMLICILYILLGMSLLSMCINLMQEQLVNKCRWLAREIGVSSAPSEAKVEGKDKQNQDKKKKKKKKKQNKTRNNNSQDPGNGPPLPNDDGNILDSMPSATGSRTSAASSRNSTADSRASSAMSQSLSTRSSCPASRSPSPAFRSPLPASMSPSPAFRSPSPASMSPSPAFRSPSPVPRAQSAGSNSLAPISMSPEPVPRSKSPMSRVSSASSYASSSSQSSFPESPKPRRPGILDDF